MVANFVELDVYVVQFEVPSRLLALGVMLFMVAVACVIFIVRQHRH